MPLFGLIHRFSTVQIRQTGFLLYSIAVCLYCYLDGICCSWIINEHGYPSFYFKIYVPVISVNQQPPTVNRQSFIKIPVQVLFQWNDRKSSVQNNKVNGTCPILNVWLAISGLPELCTKLNAKSHKSVLSA